MSNYSQEEVGFGDVQTDEEKSPKTKGAVIPTVHPTPLPRAANPVPPPLPKLPPAPNAADIMPPLPPMPSIVDNPVNQENAKTLVEYGLEAAGLAALARVGLPYLYNKFAGNKTPPSGPELTINPTTMEALTAPEATPIVAPTQTIKSRSFSPKEIAIEADINSKYPFTFEEAKKGLGLEGVKVTDPTQAEIVAKQYSNQLKTPNAPTIAPEYVPQAAEAVTPIEVVEKTAPAEKVSAEPAKAPATPAAETSKTGVTPPTASAYDKMKPTYNKGKKNPIGPGAYGWVAGQEGPKAPEVWKNLVGDKNMTYDEFMKTQKPLYEAYLGSYGEPDPFKQAANPGGYRKPTMIPESIKGAASLGGLATAAGGSLAALGALQAIKKGKETGDWTDLGQLGMDTIAGAINPALLFATHMGGTNEGEAEALAKERYKDMVGGGRGVAPPSSRSQVGRR